MGTLWFCFAAFMITGYVVFDGYDLGAGTLHLLIARTDSERRQVVQSIGPLWDGNEVWLVALGGTLFFAFPRLYATAFSGFYLPIIIVLWLLILRGISLEFRSHVDDAVWRSFWDVVFSLASTLLSFVFGVALGNISRGVVVDQSGNFFLALWTDFGVSPPVGAIDWYTISIGLFSLFTLAHHGALWLAFRTEGELQLRARRLARRTWALVLLAGAIASALTFRIQAQVLRNLVDAPWGAIFPLIAVLGLVATRILSRLCHDQRAFLASSLSIVGMIASAAFGLYPYVLPSLIDPATALTINDSLGGPHGINVALAWWMPGMALAIVYVIYVHIKFSGKIILGAEDH